eukprot:2667480-Rhodomonas_salina.2
MCGTQRGSRLYPVNHLIDGAQAVFDLLFARRSCVAIEDDRHEGQRSGFRDEPVEQGLEGLEMRAGAFVARYTPCRHAQHNTLSARSPCLLPTPSWSSRKSSIPTLVSYLPSSLTPARFSSGSGKQERRTCGVASTEQ